MTITSVLLVGLGGFIGSSLRYIMTVVVNQRTAFQFPLATFSINVIGSFVIGIVLGVASKGSMDENIRLFFATGICGGFTTFSAFSAENLKMIQEGEMATALLYILLSVVFGLLAVAGGLIIGKSL